jgi:hypothetical protein
VGFLAAVAVSIAALAGAQQQHWKSRVDIGRIEISPDGNNAFISDWADGNGILNLKTGNWTACHTRNVRFSADGKYAAGVFAETDSSSNLMVFDLSAGKESDIPVLGKACCFAPTGHTVAVQSASDDGEIVLYELPKREPVKKLNRFYQDFLVYSKGAKPNGIQLATWTNEGIHLRVTVPNAAEILDFYVDPNRDEAIYSADTTHYEGVRLADGSQAFVNVPPGPALISSWWGSEQYRVLFTQNDAGPDFPVLAGDLKLAAKANVLVANAVTRNQSVAAIWGINAVNGHSAVILKKPWPRQSAGLGYISLAVSPDGKWILYRDFDDPRQLDRAAVPREVYDLSAANVSQSRVP